MTQLIINIDDSDEMKISIMIETMVMGEGEFDNRFQFKNIHVNDYDE
jgi:hypothetical protein